MAEVGIIGNGWVGHSMEQLFPDAQVYDKYKDIGSMALVNDCEVTFVCVPTDLTDSGRVDSSIVAEVVDECESPLIVIRSTLNPGDTDALIDETGKHIVFQPEFLGETPNHPMLDPNTRQWLVIGGEPSDRRKLIDLYTSTYNANTNIRQLTAYEAEVAKLSENRAIGFKVMQMHELYQACESAGVDYYTIRDTVYGDDPRMNLWFTFIYDKLGFDSSKCLVKDIPAWAAWAESVGADAEITNLLIEKSTKWSQL